MNALDLFRSGLDYLEIATHLNTTEAEVERRIHRMRRIERIQPYLAVRAARRASIEAQREVERIAADRRVARAIASVPKPPRVKQTPEQKKAHQKAYKLRQREELREIRGRHAQ